MRTNQSGVVVAIARLARLDLARYVWLIGGLVIALAAFLFLFHLSRVNDATRAASDLAELRTYAQKVALAAEMTSHDEDLTMLEDSILQAETQTSELPVYLERILDDEEADALLADVKDAWATTADTARSYVSGDEEFDAVIAAADDTGVAVDDLLTVLTERSESRADQTRTVLQAGIVLLALGALIFGGTLLRQRRRAAEMDALTGVLSRDRFRSHLTVALLNRRPSDSVAVAIVDIDRFRRINETLGSEQGDRVLRDIARRIQDTLPRDACVGRRGGDEFLVLLPGADIEGARDAAQAILESLDQPLTYQTGELRAGVSIGLAVAPRDGTETTALILAAVGARDRAKRDGGGTYGFATGDAVGPVENTLELEVELRRALDNDEFLLYYQPQIDVESGAIVGAEALLRWRSPSRGLVSPERFIPLLEETRMIVPVGGWAIREAAAQAKQWLDLRNQPFRVAVNVSARQLFQSDLVTTVRDALETSGLPASCLELEVTETVAIQNPEEAVRVLEDLAALGIQSSLDDFGTGHSWLSHLRLLPKMSLKIDRSFVAGITRNAEDRAIVAGLVTVAHTLERTVVAEGVERAAELALLEEMHCDVAQGYYFSRPVPAEEFTNLLQRTHPWMPASAAA